MSDISQREDVRKRPILSGLYNTYLWRFKFSLNARERHFQILDSHDGKNTYEISFLVFLVGMNWIFFFGGQLSF